MKRLLIIGASGHGRVIADIAEKNGYEEIIFFDDDPSKKKCGAYPVAGPAERIQEFDGDLFIAIGNAGAREKLTDANAERNTVTLIHPAAVIAGDVEIGCGSAVMAGAVINPGAKIGRGCIINTCASVDHDCSLGDFVHIAVGAHVAGTVSIGKRTWIGAGATVSNDVTICKNCMIGAGAVVVNDLTESGTYVGLPAHLKSRKENNIL